MILNLKRGESYFIKIPCFPNIFECWGQVVRYFPQFTKRLKTEILNTALGYNFPHDERDNKLEFSRLGPAW